MYMWEHHGMSAAAALTGIMMGSGMPKQDYAPTLKQKVFARFFDHIGMGDHAAIINVIVTKVLLCYIVLTVVSASVVVLPLECCYGIVASVVLVVLLAILENDTW